MTQILSDALAYHYKTQQQYHDWYLESEYQRIPWIKIVAFKYVCYNTSCQSTLALARKDLPNYIITDLTSEKEHQYNSLKRLISTNE